MQSLNIQKTISELSLVIFHQKKRKKKEWTRISDQFDFLFSINLYVNLWLQFYIEAKSLLLAK